MTGKFLLNICILGTYFHKCKPGTKGFDNCLENGANRFMSDLDTGKVLII